jgi:hypothetical protein
MQPPVKKRSMPPNKTDVVVIKVRRHSLHTMRREPFEAELAKLRAMASFINAEFAERIPQGKVADKPAAASAEEKQPAQVQPADSQETARADGHPGTMVDEQTDARRVAEPLHSEVDAVLKDIFPNPLA